MMVLLQAVVQHGTGAAASALHHALGGKTGTTNGFTDAWFLGFSPSVTCGTWIGFDNPAQSLGDKETGAKAALPMWMDFMKVAIADKPDEAFAKPHAPKRQIDVPEPPAGVILPKPAPPETDDPDAEDSAPAGALVAPLPAADSMPDDSAAPAQVPTVKVIPKSIRAVPKAKPPVVSKPPH
jgi:penicillin-binding protein 1A